MVPLSGSIVGPFVRLSVEDFNGQSLRIPRGRDRWFSRYLDDPGGLLGNRSACLGVFQGFLGIPFRVEVR